jgi:hypothetical protein
MKLFFGKWNQPTFGFRTPIHIVKRRFGCGNAAAARGRAGITVEPVMTGTAGHRYWQGRINPGYIRKRDGSVIELMQYVFELVAIDTDYRGG